MKDRVIGSAPQCDKRKDSEYWSRRFVMAYFSLSATINLFPHLSFAAILGATSCQFIADYLAEVGYVPDAAAKDYCVVFDKELYEGNGLSEASNSSIAHKCGVRVSYLLNNESPCLSLLVSS